MFFFCRETSRREEGHVCGETGHSGDQEPAGEDQQHPPALWRWRKCWSSSRFPMCFWVAVHAMLTPLGDRSHPDVLFFFSPACVLAVGPWAPPGNGSYTVRAKLAGNTHTHTLANTLTVCVFPENTDSAVFCRQLMRTGSRASWMRRQRSSTRYQTNATAHCLIG